jgi:hypothetical protein
MLRPIAHKIIGATEGNHEKSVIKKTSILPTEQALSRIGIETSKIYDQDAILLFLSYEIPKGNTTTYSIYFTHGKGGGSTIGSKANKLVKMQSQVIADVYIMGHDHEQMGFPRGVYIADTRKKRIIFQKSLFVNSGSFLEWGGYAISGLYAPAITGSPAIKLWVERCQEGKRDLLIKRKSYSLTV